MGAWHLTTESLLRIGFVAWVASDSLTVAARFYDVVWRLFRLESDGGRFRIAACWGSSSGDVG